MFANRGTRYPGRELGVSVAVALAGWGSIAAGVYGMHVLGRETVATAAGIGVGFPVAVIAIGMTFLKIKLVRMVAAIRRGEGAIARWTVPPESFEQFRANDAARSAHGDIYRNDWILPKAIPATGLDVTFAVDGVLVGDRYFGLVNTGLMKFVGVQTLQQNPLIIEFGTVSRMIADAGSAIRTYVHRGTLRIPVSGLAHADAGRVLDHYQRVAARQTVANPGFYPARVRIGLIAAVLFFALAGIGYALDKAGIDRNSDLVFRILGEGDLETIMMIVGGFGGIWSLVLAGLAWRLRKGQLRKPD